MPCHGSPVPATARLRCACRGPGSPVGIAERHVTDPASAISALAVEAGLRARRSANVRHPDAVVVATSTPDHHVPGTAPLVAHRLRLRQVRAFDIGAGRSGSVYAAAVAAGLIRARPASAAPVTEAEKMSAVIDPADRSPAPNFGDGAGAAALTTGCRRTASPRSRRMGQRRTASRGAPFRRRDPRIRCRSRMARPGHRQTDHPPGQRAQQLRAFAW
ncbi:hypothetical protein [Streptomyces sp. NPDC005780]|uniref:hypothetical protein n=1 Tax=Streptomyces sp. NPDC005780 TaxID=3364730 RepID=UPI0036CA3562